MCICLNFEEAELEQSDFGNEVLRIISVSVSYDPIDNDNVDAIIQTV